MSRGMQSSTSVLRGMMVVGRSLRGLRCSPYIYIYIYIIILERLRRRYSRRMEVVAKSVIENIR